MNTAKSTKWIVREESKDRPDGYYTEPHRTKKAAYEHAEQAVRGGIRARIFRRYRDGDDFDLDFELYETLEPATLH